MHKVFSVSNCIVEGGSALYKGSGSYCGTWRNCIIRNCTVRNPSSTSDKEGSGGAVWGGKGGGTCNCWVTNSLIAWNKTRINNASGVLGGGAGVFYGKVYNSTIQYNQTTKYGTNG